MTRKVSLCMAVVFATGSLAAGCGGGDDNNDNGGGNGGSKAPSVNQNDPRVKQAVSQCEQSIKSASQLSAKAKKDLQNVCKDAAKGDQNAVKKATRKVCVTIAKESAPAGAARDQAISTCKQAAP